MTYRHTQIGWRQRVVMLLVSAVMAVIALRLPASEPLEAGLGMLAAAIVLLAFAFWMSRLTIVIDDDRLDWYFGPGFPRQSVALADIENAEIARTRWWLGWGVRWTPRGWFYTVAGRDVVVVFRRGARPVMLGTDEPGRLHDALERALAARR